MDDFSAVLVTPSDRNTRLRYEIVKSNYFLVSKDKEKALVQYNTAIKLADDQNTPDQLGLIYSNMADSYSELQDYKTAYEN